MIELSDEPAHKLMAAVTLDHDDIDDDLGAEHREAWPADTYPRDRLRVVKRESRVLCARGPYGWDSARRT